MQKGIKSKNGFYWCNALINGHNKLVIAKELSETHYKCFSNSSLVQNLPEWKPSEEKPGFKECILTIKSINQFFNFNYGTN